MVDGRKDTRKKTRIDARHSAWWSKEKKKRNEPIGAKGGCPAANGRKDE
jgi:hypothetical protein